MKKLLAVVLMVTVLLTLALSGCSTEVKANTEAGQTVNTVVGQEFTIALGSNPTTGYSWHPNFDSVKVEKVSNEYKADDTTGKQIVGSGGTEYFVFKGLQKGETQITFTYYRPWETPTAQDHTQVFTISIK